MKMNDIIYTDEAAIARNLIAAKRAVKFWNTAIEEITETGIELTDELIVLLAENQEAFIAEAKRQVEEEHRQTSRFKLMRKDVDTTPVIDALRSVLFRFSEKISSLGDYSLDMIEIKGLRASICPKFEENLYKMHSIQLDTPEKYHVYQLAEKAQQAINELEDFLNSFGTAIHSCSTNNGIYSRCVLLMGGDMDRNKWRPQIFPQAIACITKSKLK